MQVIVKFLSLVTESVRGSDELICIITHNPGAVFALFRGNGTSYRTGSIEA